MSVRFSDGAAARFDAIDAWWRENRDKAPGLFDKEVAAAIATLDAAPNAGAFYKRVRGREVRRLLLKKTRHYLYYRLDDDGDVEVITIWGAQRRFGPRL
ncbi:MAG: type II toxin-antitoxin system RelE/ParE family toxin [Polyangiaceae bacterium]